MKKTVLLVVGALIVCAIAFSGSKKAAVERASEQAAQNVQAQYARVAAYQTHDDIDKYEWTNRAFAKQWLDVMSHDPANLNKYIVFTERVIKKYTSGRSEEGLMLRVAKLRVKQSQQITMSYPVLSWQLNNIFAKIEMSTGTDLRDVYFKTNWEDFE